MIVWLISLAFLGFILYRYIWHPWKLKKWYVSKFRERGYRVFEIPLKPFQMAFLSTIDLDEQTKDCMPGGRSTTLTMMSSSRTILALSIFQSCIPNSRNPFLPPKR